MTTRRMTGTTTIVDLIRRSRRLGRYAVPGGGLAGQCPQCRGFLAVDWLDRTRYRTVSAAFEAELANHLHYCGPDDPLPATLTDAIRVLAAGRFGGGAA